jgi:DNA-directed RNA polymerase beta subunit
MEATLMKAFGVISTTALLLLFGAAVPAFAQEEKAQPTKQEEKAQPAKQEEKAKPAKEEKLAKPAKEEKQAKPTKEEKQAEAKPGKQEQAKPAKEEKQAKPAKEEKQAQAKPEKQEHIQQAKGQQGRQPEHAQGQWAHNGQKDSRGHEYNESRFGHDHHTRFEETGGRMYNGRREYSYGGYWFYAGAYPAWFYRQDVYFIMGADGLWYAVAYDDPSFTFQVNIE